MLLIDINGEQMICPIKRINLKMTIETEVFELKYFV